MKNRLAQRCEESKELGLSLQSLTERNDADVIWERERLARMQAGCPRSQRSLPNGTEVQAKVLSLSRMDVG
jgi:hypothetical protein